MAPLQVVSDISGFSVDTKRRTGCSLQQNIKVKIAIFEESRSAKENSAAKGITSAKKEKTVHLSTDFRAKINALRAN